MTSTYRVRLGETHLNGRFASLADAAEAACQSGFGGADTLARVYGESGIAFDGTLDELVEAAGLAALGRSLRPAGRGRRSSKPGRAGSTPAAATTPPTTGETTMATFTVYADGNKMGELDAADERAAVDAMARDAGYRSYEDLADAIGVEASEGLSNLLIERHPG